jgi:hypothetical protein
LQTQAQRLIDVAQEIGAIQSASTALVRAADRLLSRGQIEEAGGYFAAAIIGDVLALNAGPDEVGWPIMALVFSAHELPPTEQETLIAQVLETVGEQEGMTDSALEDIRDAIRAVQQTMAPSIAVTVSKEDCLMCRLAIINLQQED